MQHQKNFFIDTVSRKNKFFKNKKTEKLMEENGVSFRHVLKNLNCSCLLCGKKYSEKAKLYRHLRDVHHHKIVLPVTIHFCHICYKGFANKTNVRRHISDVHDGMKNCSENANPSHQHLSMVLVKHHFCQICNRGFSCKKNVLRHISAVHDGVKNFLCLVCDRAFSLKDNLMRHIFNVHKVLNNRNEYVQVQTSQENNDNNLRAQSFTSSFVSDKT